MSSIVELRSMVSEYENLKTKQQSLKDISENVNEIKVKKLEKEILDGDYQERWMMFGEIQKVLGKAVYWQDGFGLMFSEGIFKYAKNYIRIEMWFGDDRIIYGDSNISLKNKRFILECFIKSTNMYEAYVKRQYKDATEKIKDNINQLEEKIKNI